jgi:hypothetical protein
LSFVLFERADHYFPVWKAIAKVQGKKMEIQTRVIILGRK